MKIVRFERFGGPEVLHVEEAPMPRLRAGEALVRVMAASVNPVDWKMRSGESGMLQPAQLPSVPGRDISGIIEEDPTGRFQPGDAVFAMLSFAEHGYQEYAAIAASRLVPKPRRMSHDEAAAVPLAGMTAWQGLVDHGRLEAGQRVLIHGGVGGVGHLAVQIAKAMGAWVATTVSAQDIGFARNLGADEAIDYRGQRFETMLKPVDLVLDLIGGDVQRRSIAVMRPGASLISTLTTPQVPRGLRGISFTVRPDAGELAEMAEMIDRGQLRVTVQRTYPLESAAEAQRSLERDHIRGKVVLHLAA